MTTSAEVRDRIIAMLRRDLIGPLPPTVEGDPDADLQRERLGEPPAGWYLTGFIGPQGEAVHPEGAADDPDAAEERETAGGEMLDDAAEPREDDDTGAVAQDDAPPEAPVVKRRFVPASIGITVMLPDEVEAIDVRVTWGDYTTEPPLSLEQLAEGVEEELPKLEWLRQPREAVVRLAVPEPGERSEKAVPASVTPLMPGGGLVLRAHARPYELPEPGGPRRRVKVVSVFVVNQRPTARKRVADVTYAFQARLELSCDAGFVARHDTSGYDTDDPDRRLADLHYRDIAEFAVGRNVSGAWRADDDGVVRRVWSDPLPVAAVERVAANDDPAPNDSVTFEMEALAQAAEAGGDEIGAALEGFPALYGAWIATQDALTTGLAPRRAETARQLIGDMARARARIESGIQRLRDEPRARQAFRIANLAIASALRRRAAGAAEDPAAKAVPRWRPFQLAYIRWPPPPVLTIAQALRAGRRPLPSTPLARTQAVHAMLSARAGQARDVDPCNLQRQQAAPPGRPWREPRAGYASSVTTRTRLRRAISRCPATPVRVRRQKGSFIGGDCPTCAKPGRRQSAKRSRRKSSAPAMARTRLAQTNSNQGAGACGGGPHSGLATVGGGVEDGGGTGRGAASIARGMPGDRLRWARAQA